MKLAKPASIWIAQFAVLLCVVSSLAAAQQPQVAVFAIEERFGVSHSRQIIEFDAPQFDPADCSLVDSEGREVAYQRLATGKVAIQTALAAHEKKQWRLIAGRAPQAQPKDAVVVQHDEQTGDITIGNGLIGVRVPSAARAASKRLAAIQGVVLRDGALTATGPNQLEMSVNDTWVPADLASVSLTFEERGAIRTRIAWDFVIAPQPKQTQPGHYRVSIELEAGRPSLLTEEESDRRIRYRLNVYDNLAPDQARYQGHHSTSVAAGREATGIQYRPWNERSDKDALVDLAYKTPRAFPRMAIWNPWITDSGWYWHLYNADARSQADTLGIFAGRASRAAYAAASGVNLETTPLGVEDISSAMDAGGAVHVAYRSGRQLWYVRFSPAFESSPPQLVGDDLVLPDLAVNADGRVSLAAFDLAANALVVATSVGEPSGQPALNPVAIRFAEPGKVVLRDQHAYQAYSGSEQFLLLFCDYDGKAGGHIFKRTDPDGAYAYVDTLRDGRGARQAERPSMVSLPDGGVAIGYSRDTYFELATLAKGQTALTYAELPSNTATRFVDLGGAVDPVTGNAFVVEYPGAGIAFLRPDDRGLGTNAHLTRGLAPTIDAHGQGPNRRTIATSPEGDALAAHGSQAFFITRDGTASAATVLGDLGVHGARVHFHGPSSQFIMLGRHDGMLALHGWRFGEASARLLQNVPSSQRNGALLNVELNPPISPPNSKARFQWGLFAGVKGQDLRPQTVAQPINLEMNLRAGISLKKVQQIPDDFEDTPLARAGTGSDQSYLPTLIARLRADALGKYGTGYYGHLYNAEPAARDLIDMWADKTGSLVHKMSDDIALLARELVEAYENRFGIYDFGHHYWHGGVAMNRALVRIEAVLADPLASPQDRAAVKAAAMLFAAILNDEDFVPLSTPTGLNLGTANMPVQQSGYRDAFALFLAGHSLVREEIPRVAESALATLRRVINEHGASIGSTNYAPASFLPTLATLLKLQQIGAVDAFRTEPRLARSGEFFMQFLTPPEPRFGGLRKMVALGDGSTTGSSTAGQIAAGFKTADPALASRLMDAWRSQGSPRNGFFTPTLSIIDEGIPSRDAALTSAYFPGYFSVLRSGWGSREESSLWLVNGDFYSDHRHDDRGLVSLYALGAPLSVHWGSMYQPRAVGPNINAMVVPERNLPNWNRDQQGVGSEVSSGWTTSRSDLFLSFTHATVANARMTGAAGQWRRQLKLIHPDAATPMIVIRDEFDGALKTEAKIFTLPLMAQGDIATPQGATNPVTRSWFLASSLYKGRPELREGPSITPTIDLPPGLHRFSFTGQAWKQHPTGGIDWSLYVDADEDQQAVFGNWAHNWHPTTEMAEYMKANAAPFFEERQHILRLRSKTGFKVLILPYKKGMAPPDLKVERVNADIVVSYGGRRVRIHDDYYVFEGEGRTIVTSFGADLTDVAGVTTRGGALEVVIENGKAVVTAGRTEDAPRVSIQGNWRAVDGAVAEGTLFQLKSAQAMLVRN